MIFLASSLMRASKRMTQQEKLFRWKENKYIPFPFVVIVSLVENSVNENNHRTF